MGGDEEDGEEGGSVDVDEVGGSGFLGLVDIESTIWIHQVAR